MASILVYIELDGESPTRASVEALGAGRRIATTLGAALHAMVPWPTAATELDEDHWVSTLGEAGADKVVMIAGPTGPALWSSHGPLLRAAAARLRPLLVLVAATPAGRDIAPRLATRMDAAFVAEPSIEHDDQGHIVLLPAGDAPADRAAQRRLALADIAGPAVVTLTPGAHQPAQGYDEAEALCLEPPDPPGAGIDSLDSADAPDGALASRLVDDDSPP